MKVQTKVSSSTLDIDIDIDCLMIFTMQRQFTFYISKFIIRDLNKKKKVKAKVTIVESSY
ncbi:CLUMA_CG014856, isoform A [Clunio marinus]|uniref:CLUMA_CG014856, isoform A n=1 Tax=Clunio marinus TaxID=568069 RepID=A0A1J1IQ19_9DIPT|nr:CLUMA_CG014856, isoform A [Clunio marinus]